MRIIAGSAKGKTLVSPPDTRTRPTSDRAREGLFSSLESEFSSIQGLHFLDLFAGSGAVGVEALSRGASVVHSVESDVAMESIALKNFQSIKLSDGMYRVFLTKSERFLLSDYAAEKGQYDIIFMDPPYELQNKFIEELIEVIQNRALLSPRGIIAIERKSKSSPFTWPHGMEEIKVRSYGLGSIFYGGYSASVLP
ncbi:MAG: 16S rRNA (guanine(966)-N(2))-methyltransferase RsmD [Actinomycetota bacterium]